ncbi:(2Fe-2S)-binding protein [Alkalimarinus sediminis]|uniref:(2Fe-2S)-binding protein n=1 Tax=Alkalimarinus sediminis TaxID=1632866 RepID=A0A9E8HH50_9ALTE|nr:(2Fe-2S)-binding protein [Alkalimarinus sediminis]UZW74170.1 (2Fe-2S)-binding protein [Alkalimarinus sediminis]
MKIAVNGVERVVEFEPDTPLLWVIRDELKLKGTKFGCGKGLCGACTVHLNGDPIRSCITPVSAVENQNITTIEGIGSEESPHPLQASWVEFNVPQCGYCQSGQLMSASALLAKNANPTDADIDSAMSGNACRCGTYPRIKAAIHHAAENLKDS